MFDVSRRVTLVNPVARDILGMDGITMTLDQALQVFRGEQTSENLDTITQGVQNALMSAETTRIDEAQAGRKSFEMYIAPIRDYQKNISGGAIILHDITHLKEIDKMKTEFVSVASHQLRTPLTAIRLFAEMLISGNEGKLNAKQKYYLDNVHESALRMVKLVNDLLNVSRIETGRLKIEPELVQLEDFIQNIINEAMPLAKAKNCAIIFNKPRKKLPKVSIDPSLMRQVIHNLVMNAVRYSRPAKNCGMKVTLERENKKSKEQESNILISVADNGIGIPKEMQSRIFEKFFRADNAVKAVAEGTGLGLYIAKMIVESSGGKIWFESEKDKGSTFYFTIPAGGMKEKEGEVGIAK